MSKKKSLVEMLGEVIHNRALGKIDDDTFVKELNRITELQKKRDVQAQKVQDAREKHITELEQRLAELEAELNSEKAKKQDDEVSNVGVNIEFDECRNKLISFLMENLTVGMHIRGDDEVITTVAIASDDFLNKSGVTADEVHKAMAETAFSQPQFCIGLNKISINWASAGDDDLNKNFTDAKLIRFIEEVADMLIEGEITDTDFGAVSYSIRILGENCSFWTSCLEDLMTLVDNCKAAKGVCEENKEESDESDTSFDDFCSFLAVMRLLPLFF